MFIFFFVASHFDLKTASEPPPCGEVCSYNGTYHPGTYYPFIWKDIDCTNIMGRMAWRNWTIEYPPPRSPPPDLYDAFTQNGECLIRSEANSDAHYFIDFGPLSKDQMAYSNFYSRMDIEKMMKIDRDGGHLNSYNDDELVSKTLKDYLERTTNKNAFVVGTRRPWLESIILNNRVKHVTTLEYGKITLRHPKVTVYNPYTFTEKYLDGVTELFDFGASYSSIEHSGLGRYGDPINPYGDLEAMAQIWCLTKPGGLFFLAVPTSTGGKSFILWNAHRMYGYSCLQHLTANWNVLEIREGVDWFKQDVIVLSKPLTPMGK